MKGGYKNFVHQDAVLVHNVRGSPSLAPVDLKVGPMKVRAYEWTPFRCYYYCRNSLYFILYELEKGRFGLLSGVLWRVRRSGHVGPIRGGRLERTSVDDEFPVAAAKSHPTNPRLLARHLWHGVSGNIAARY